MTPEFFAIVRKQFGSLSQEQVDGFNSLGAELLAADLSLPHRAYLMATAWHETAHTMQPIHERGKVSYFNKYEPGTKIGRVLGNTQKGDGYRYRGRGYVQLTGRANYAAASRKIGVDLINVPDRALDPDVAAHILIQGCLGGWFTGKSLTDYATYEDMRRVVNGTDRAGLIAGYARTFQAALQTVPFTPPAPKTAAKPSRSFWADFFAGIAALFGRKR